MKFNYLKKFALAGLLAVSAGLPLAANAEPGLYPLSLTINLAFTDENETSAKIKKFTLNNTGIIHVSNGLPPDLGDVTGTERAEAIAFAKTRRLFALLDLDTEFCNVELFVADTDGTNETEFGLLNLCVDDTDTYGEANFSNPGNIAIGFTTGLTLDINSDDFDFFTSSDQIDTGGADPAVVNVPRRILMKGSAVVKKTCEVPMGCDEETLTFTATSLSGTGMVGELQGFDGEDFVTQVVGGSFKINLKTAPLAPPQG